MFLRVLFLFGLLVASSVVAASKPNVVIILSDDYGWGSAGCYGANPELIKTPNIDRLAKEGRRFTDACTTSSVCSPTRYSVVTGRYCWRTSLQSEVLSTLAPLHIETDRLTIASMLKSQGYTSAAIGKWHLGYGTAERCDYTKELKPGPLEIGFDYHFSVPSNHGDITGAYVEDHWVYGLNQASPSDPSPPYVTMGEQKGKAAKNLALNAPKRVDENVMTTLTDKTLAWLAKQTADKPFFLYFTPVAVHNPVTPGPDTKGKSKGGLFCDWVSELDNSVGRVLEALDKQGLAENTIVLFSSDNGGVNKPENKALLQTAAQEAGLKPVGPFRGGKHDVWEGGFRVPYIVRWPGHVPAATVCDEPVSLVDTLASVAAITGYTLPPPAKGAEDSFDVSKAWLGSDYQSPLRPHVIEHSADGNFAIRRGPLKWIEGIPADDVKPAAKKVHADQFKPQLYDLKQDIAETKDVLAEQANAANELATLLNRYRDGGYSRELPPVTPKKETKAADLPPLTGAKVVDLALAEMPAAPWKPIGGKWSAHDGAVWCKAAGADKGATLQGPVSFTDGTVQFELHLGEADRMSLRIHTTDKQSYRAVVNGSGLEIAINPPPGADKEQTRQLARTRVKAPHRDWQTVRLSFQGPQLTVQFAGTTTTVSDPIFAQPKAQLNFIGFEGELGLRKLVVTK